MNKIKSFPKTIILCQNKINEFTGGGIVLSNLFGKVPPDRLMFFHRDIDYGGSSLFVEKKLDGRWLRFNLINAVELFFRWGIALLFYFKKASFQDLKNLLLQSCYFYFPKDVDQQVKEFAPEILYAWCSDNLWVKTVQSVAKRYDIPYVIHFMDNHVDLTPETSKEIAVFPVFRRNLIHLVHNSAQLFTISESMGKVYQARWNKSFEIFHGLIESEKWPLPNLSSLRDGPFRIVFTGSVEQGQLLGLKDVAQALDVLINKGVNIRLALYLTPSYIDSVKSTFSHFKCVEILPHPDFSLLRNELSKADLLLLAYGFDDQTINYYRYSFATKIVPYMLSGRAILVYGPKEIEPVRYAADGGWASVLTIQNQDVLIDTITVLMRDKEKRDMLSDKAWTAGVTEHDLDLNARRFKSSMTKISKTL
jgi:hypothetical protein